MPHGPQQPKKYQPTQRFPAASNMAAPSAGPSGTPANPPSLAEACWPPRDPQPAPPRRAYSDREHGLYQRELPPATRPPIGGAQRALWPASPQRGRARRPPALRQALTLIALGLSLLASGCAGGPKTRPTISVQIEADGERASIQIPQGSTVKEALDSADISLGLLDRIEPPAYQLVEDGTLIRVIRVEERFEIEQRPLGYQEQILPSETLPEGEVRVVQAGKEGVEEVTIRIVLEDGVEVLRAPVRRVIIQEPLPEILMVGVAQRFAPPQFEGIIAYMSGGNAWVIDGQQGSRRALVSTGDLDGRVFALSPDGAWLLFSRRPQGDVEPDQGAINSLWIVSLTSQNPSPRPLLVENVVHFADWSPTSPDPAGQYWIAASTVEPVQAAPGWQANNDLILLKINATGTVIERLTLLETHAGGPFGWWGTRYLWAPSGDRLAYARADVIGWVDLANGEPVRALGMVPFRAGADWIWLPPLAWNIGGTHLYFIGHGGDSLETSMTGLNFGLFALELGSGRLIPILGDLGIFAQLAIRPPVDAPGEERAGLALLRALDPSLGEDSLYALFLADLDGSNLSRIYPAAQEPGLAPTPILWSPHGEKIAILERGDLYLIDVQSGRQQPLTADGQTLAFDWAP